MARKREFDPGKALDAAMKEFWVRGYYATSIDDLVEATGVSRYGLYAVHENKRGLFLAALDHYRATVLQGLIDRLRRPEASLDAVKDMVLELGRFASVPSGRCGCLLWNSASEVAPHDKDAAIKVTAFRGQLAASFAAVLSRAVEKKELPRDYDVPREADFLCGVVQTLSVFARSGADRKIIANFVSTSLVTLA